MEKLIWFHEKLTPISEAKISVLSATSQFGLNVFEGIRAYKQTGHDSTKFFKFHDHYLRLQKSLKLIGLGAISHPCETLEQICKNVLTANKFTDDCSLRITYYIEEEGSWHSTSPPRLFVNPSLTKRRELSTITSKTACTSTWRRITDLSMPPRVKSGANYINGRYAQMEASKNNYDLPILLNENGKVAEGAGACIFIVRDNVLITPTETDSILESITRKTILEIAKKLEIGCEIRSIDRSELYLADEVFLCGSAAEITTIRSVDRFQIGKGEIGDIQKQLLSYYHLIVSGGLPEYSNWLT